MIWQAPEYVDETFLLSPVVSECAEIYHLTGNIYFVPINFNKSELK
jgi:hypothetical protein